MLEKSKNSHFEAMKRKKHPIISEEHFLQMTESSTVLRNYLLLAEVRLNNQTDGAISAFWNIWTNLAPSRSAWMCSKQGASMRKTNRKEKYRVETS